MAESVRAVGTRRAPDVDAFVHRLEQSRERFVARRGRWRHSERSARRALIAPRGSLRTAGRGRSTRRNLRTDNLSAMFVPDCSRVGSPSSPAAAPASVSRSRSASVRSARASPSAAGTRETSRRERGAAPAGLDPLAFRSTSAIPSRWTRWSSARSSTSGSIDILVNNAAGNFVCRAEDLSPNGWNAVVGIVLNGRFYCSRAVGRQMIRAATRRLDRVDPRELRLDGQRRHCPFGGRKGRRHVDDPDACRRMGAPRDPRERRRARPDRSRPAPPSSSGTSRTPSNGSRRWSPERWGRPEEVADAVAFLVLRTRRLHHGRSAHHRWRRVARQGTFGFVD